MPPVGSALRLVLCSALTFETAADVAPLPGLLPFPVPLPHSPASFPNKAFSRASLSHRLLLEHLSLQQELSPVTSCVTLDKVLVLFEPVSSSASLR